MTLIFDNRYKGHHFEYVKHLIDYLKTGEGYIFLLHPNVIKRLEGHYPSERIASFRIEPFPEVSENFSFLKRIYEESCILRKIVKDYKISHLIFMFLDAYQLVIGLKYLQQVKLSGILFFPPIQLTSVSVGQQLKADLKKWRKLKQLQWCVGNAALQSIFILQDKRSPLLLNKKFKTDIFRTIVEPIGCPFPLVKEATCPSFFPELHEFEGKFIGLVFGSISEFKNIPNLLQAIQLLPTKYREEIVLLIVGPYASLKDESIIESLIQQNKDITILRLNRFIEKGEAIQELFNRSSVILMPYINFYGSSGVLGHAAKNRKLVLTPNEGIIADLVYQYQLGVTCTPASINSLTESLLELLLNYSVFEERARFEDFLTGRTPELFASTLLNN